MRQSVFIFLIFTIAAALATTARAQRLIERASSLVDGRVAPVKKVVFVSPDFTVYRFDATNKKHTPAYAETEERTKNVQNLLADNAQKAGIQASVKDVTNINAGETDYFNELLRLRQAIYQANSDQDISNSLTLTEKNFLGKPKGDAVTFTRPPMLNPEFSYLAAKYGTPYFVVSGVNTVMEKGAATYYYLLVANVVTCEIVYREMRLEAKAGADQLIGSLFFDSFTAMQQTK